jgi:hypothetical protein
VTAPEGFVTVEVDPETGLLATPMCPRRVRQELPGWRAPLRTCGAHMPQQQLAYFDAPTGYGPQGQSDGLAEYISGRASERPPVRIRDDVTLLFGQGSEIHVGRGSTVPTLRQGSTLETPVAGPESGPSGSSDARPIDGLLPRR